MRIKPKPGLLVRDPINFQHISPDGVEVPDTIMPGVPDSAYWQQLLRFGDVETIKAAAPAAPAAPAKADAPAKPDA